MKQVRAIWKGIAVPLITTLVGLCCGLYLVNLLPAWHDQVLARVGENFLFIPAITEAVFWIGGIATVVTILYGLLQYMYKLFS